MLVDERRVPLTIEWLGHDNDLSHDCGLYGALPLHLATENLIKMIGKIGDKQKPERQENIYDRELADILTKCWLHTRKHSMAIQNEQKSFAGNHDNRRFFSHHCHYHTIH